MTVHDPSQSGGGAGERPIFQCEGEYWTIAFAGTVCHIRDSIGLRQIAWLIASPGKQVSAATLAASTERADGRRVRLSDDGGDPRHAAEAARVRVRHTIQRALVRITAHHPELSEHLRATLKTGGDCAYLPDPRVSRGRALALRATETHHNVTGNVTPSNRDHG